MFSTLSLRCLLKQNIGFQAALARLLAERRARMQAAIPAGPRDDPPSYEAIDAQPHNRLFMHMFRQSVAEGLGEDAPEPGWVCMSWSRLCRGHADTNPLHQRPTGSQHTVSTSE